MEGVLSTVDKVYKTTSALTDVSSQLAKGVMSVAGKTVSNVSPKAGLYVKDVGDTVVDTTRFTINSMAKVLDATIQTGVDMKDRIPLRKSQGVKDLGDVSLQLISGVGQSVIYTFQNGQKVVKGIVRNESETLNDGLRNIGKIVVVGTFAFGFVDLLDGSETVEASDYSIRNGELAGEFHAETGISFEQKTVELPSGETLNAAFPVFDSKFTVVLVEELYESSDAQQFRIANDMLFQAIVDNPSLREEIGLTYHDIDCLEMGRTPEEFVWHHSEDQGVLQLVNKELHQNTGHTGGREIWGGGTENR